MRYDRDGTVSFSMRLSIASRIRIGRVAVMLAILFDFLPAIARAFLELDKVPLHVLALVVCDLVEVEALPG